MAHLDRVIGLLAAGQDIAAEALPGKLNCLLDVVKFKARVTEFCGRIWPGQTPPQGAEERDWSALRSCAEALLKLLEKWLGNLPTPVVRALTAPDTRNQLTAGVQQHDAANAAGFPESWRFLAGLFDLAQPISSGITIEAAPLPDLRRWLVDRAEDAYRLREWTQFCEVEREVVRAEVPAILTEVLNGDVKPEDAGEAFRARFFRLWLDAVHERVPALRQFATDNHERLIQRFRELDRGAIASAVGRIRSLQLSRSDRPRLMTGEAPGSSELGTLTRKANKKR